MGKRGQTMNSNQKKFPVQALETEGNPSILSDIGVAHPDEFNDLIDAFGVHAWVYACANLIANAFSMIEFIPYVKKKNDEWVVNENHPFRKLMASPNPHMSALEFKRIISLSSKLTGNAFIVIEPDERRPTEFWPLQPSKVKVKTDSINFVSGYSYSVNGNSTFFPAERIIHVREASPSNLQYGQGALTAAKNAVMSDSFADAWNRNFFKNSARPDAILQSDTSLDIPTQKRLVSSWLERFNGPKNRAQVAVLAGVKYVEVNRNHEDMQFVQLRKMLREEILATFGVPQSMVGILDQANYSNMKEQTKVFWNQTMIPEIRKFESVLTLRASQITGDDKTVIQADLSKVEALREDEMQKATIAQTYFNIGIPLSQVVEALDLPFKINDGPKENGPEKSTDENGDGQEVGDREETGGKKFKALIKKDSAMDMEWKKFDRSVLPIEQDMESALRAFFRSQARRVLSKFSDVAERIVPPNGKQSKTLEDDIKAFFDFDKEKNLFGRVSEKWIRKGYYQAARRMAERIGGQNSGSTYQVDERVAGAWIQRKVLKLQQEVTRFTYERLTEAVVEGVRDAVAEGLTQSESIAQIVDRIEEFYEFSATGRAERIARTEVIGANNAATLESMKALGAVGKRWLTSRDNRVREVHDRMEGQEVGIDDSFLTSDGEALMFPGDPSAGPGAIINCRCTLLEIMPK